MQADKQHLRALLPALSTEALEALAKAARLRGFSLGETLVLEGDACEAIFLIERGVVRLRQIAASGRECVVGWRGKSQWVNLACALHDAPSPAAAEAVAETHVWTIAASELIALMRDHPTLGVALSQQLAEETLRLSALVKELALLPVRSRLARFLLEHLEVDAPRTRWTQESIAAQIGTVRDVVGRTLRAFVDEGLIGRERGRLVVLNRAALEGEAEER